MTAEVDEMVETLRSKVCVGIWDTGCRKTVAGANWLRNYVQALAANLGFPVEFATCAEKFKFGNQDTRMSEKCWYLPVTLCGGMGTLAVNEVPGERPLLISEESMKRLGVVLRLRQKQIDIEDLVVQGATSDFHPQNGHPIA